MKCKFVQIVLMSTLIGNSCSPKVRNSIEGEYCSLKSNQFETIFYNSKFENSIGNKLFLHKDSTFEYLDCSNVIKGNWAISNTQDSLILYCKQYKSRDEVKNNWRDNAYDSIPYMFFTILENGNLVDTIKTKHKVFLNLLSKCK